MRETSENKALGAKSNKAVEPTKAQYKMHVHKDGGFAGVRVECVNVWIGEGEHVPVHAEPVADHVCDLLNG